MRKPAHATGATHFTATVFEKGKRHAVGTVEGTDPSKIAKGVSEVDSMPEAERKSIRPAIRKALKQLADGAIPNLTDTQFDMDGRRVRIKIGI